VFAKLERATKALSVFTRRLFSVYPSFSSNKGKQNKNKPLLIQMETLLAVGLFISNDLFYIWFSLFMDVPRFASSVVVKYITSTITASRLLLHS